MTGLFPSLGAAALLLAAASAAGVLLAAAFVPPGRERRVERLGWGIALGLGILSLAEAGRVLVPFGPAWPVFVVAGVASALIGRWLRIRGGPVDPPATRDRTGRADRALPAIAGAGVLLYALRALSEPMRSSDFLAIWGLKGKALFAMGRFPAWLVDPIAGGYSHPEYPLGLPFLLAGLATLMGRWDDQALALVYPVFQVASLLVLFGWLRRLGVSRTVAGAAAALLALFEPLYSSFLTGMAEIPLGLAMLLVGTSLSDALDGSDPGALRRLAAASLLAASIKNEGLFFAVAAGAVAVLSRVEKSRRLPAAAAALLPALLLAIGTRLVRGPLPLRDFDFGLLAPARLSELVARIATTARVDFRIAIAALPLLAAGAVLLACGRRNDSADRLLVLAAISLAAYLALPAFAVLGPEWLAETTLFRTAAALAPVAMAGIAGRYAPKQA